MRLLTSYSLPIRLVRRSCLGTLLIALVMASALACGPVAQPTVAPNPEPTVEPTPSLVEVPAPIDGVSMAVPGSGQSDADLVIVSGLPNACHSFGHYTIERSGDTLTVEVVNTRPDDPMMACAEIYGMVTTNIPVPGQVETCEFYDVVINGEDYRVQAIAPNARCAGDTAGQSSEVVLAMGDRTNVGEGLVLTLMDVSEDSRCPSDAVCVWAGRATVVLEAELDGASLNPISLSIEGGVGDSSAAVGGYTIQLLQLDPYPVSTSGIPMGEYVATVLVSGT